MKPEVLKDHVHRPRATLLPQSHEARDRFADTEQVIVMFVDAADDVLGLVLEVRNASRKATAEAAQLEAGS